MNKKALQLRGAFLMPRGWGLSREAYILNPADKSRLLARR